MLGEVQQQHGSGENSWAAPRAAAAGPGQSIRQNAERWGGRRDVLPNVQGSVISVKMAFLSETFPMNSIPLISDTEP